MNVKKVGNVILVVKDLDKSVEGQDDTGIVVIDDDLKIDTEKELEERRAYLEEARSQETSD